MCEWSDRGTCVYVGCNAGWGSKFVMFYRSWVVAERHQTGKLRGCQRVTGTVQGRTGE